MEKIFKAKRIDNGEWHEFSLDDINGEIHFSDDEHIWSGSFITLDKNTICQFTGIKDSEGQRIFEGDEVKGYKYDSSKPYVVRYHASKYSCGFVASDNEECNPYINVWYEGLTLTGHNIHDNT